MRRLPAREPEICLRSRCREAEGRADLIARDYVAGSTWNTAGRLWSPALPNVRYGTDPADALDIAASLRAVAVVISGMAAYLRRVSIWRQDPDESSHGGNLIDGLDTVVQNLGKAVFRPVELRDTS